MIEDSAGRVSSGTRLVDGAGKTMEEISASVQRVAGLMREVAAANREQFDGIEQVGRAVTHMEQAVQQNAALVEQSAAAAEHMSDQAEVLAQTVARFKISEADRADEAQQSMPAESEALPGSSPLWLGLRARQ